MTTQNEIDPKRFYTLHEIVRDGLIPGIDTIRKASKLMQTDAVTNRTLGARRVTYGEKGTKYRVKGSNIIQFLTQRDDV